MGILSGRVVPRLLSILFAVVAVVVALALTGCQSDEVSEGTPKSTPTASAETSIGTPSDPVATTPPPAPTQEPTPDPPAVQAPQLPAPPELDRSIHSVELSDIVFDRFDGTTTRLSGASNALIDRLRDAIKPIYKARYEDASGGDWLEPDDLVVGYLGSSDQAYAYPIKILNFHELVNDEIDGVPLIVTYCPLCGSGVVFDRRIASGDESLVFGNTSALYNSDLVMFDHTTGSYWFQTGGEAVVGTMTGSRLTPLPSFVISWSEWLDLHPATKVLSREQGLGTRASQYLRDPFSTYADFINEGENRYPFPVDPELVGSALRPAEVVVAVAIDGVERAYPPGRIGDSAVNDQIGGQDIVIFSRLDGAVATVFSRELGDEQLEFELIDGEFRDSSTGSTWNLAGVAVSGELEGARLTPLPSRRAFWFSISVSNQNIEIYGQ